MEQPLKIWFDRPAADWNEALPVGNGRLGGMVFGTPFTEVIALNEDSVWSGGYRDRNNPQALEKLGEIRRLMAKGKVSQAQELAYLAWTGVPEGQRFYEPLGNLYLLFDGPAEEPTASCLGKVERAAQKGWEKLLEDHVSDHRALFDRVTFTLEEEASPGVGAEGPSGTGQSSLSRQ